MPPAALNDDLQECIRTCTECHETCLSMAMGHCLELGGRHAEPQHLRLMLNCAQLCRTAADFMLSGSQLHGVVCGACAAVCEACANSCDAVGDMRACADACRVCAESCRSMAQADQAVSA